MISILSEQAREESGPLTFQTLVQKLGQKAAIARDNPRLPASGMPRGDDREKVWAYEEAPLLEDIALNRRFRASLETLGLIEVSYEGVSEVVGDILPHAKLLGLQSDRTQLTFLVNRLLDQFRQSGALHRDMLRYHTGYLNYPETLRGADWARRIGTISGLPANAERKVDLRQEGEIPKGVTVRPIWQAEKGAKPAPEKLLLHLARRFSQGHAQETQVQEKGLSLLMESLADQGLITLDKLYGYSNQPIELYQVNDAGLQLALATDARRARCNRCSLVVCGNEVRGMPCPRCSGTLSSFSQQEVLSNRYAKRASLPAAQSRRHGSRVHPQYAPRSILL